MRATGQDSLKTRRTLTVDGKSYEYFSLEAAAQVLGDISRLPYSLKVLLENLLRFEDGRSVTVDSSLEGFHDIVERAARAAEATRIDLTMATRVNLRSMGLSVAGQDPV